MIGTAAASIPIGLGNNNLPIGMQIIAPRYQDIKIFELAYAIEENQPWTTTYNFTI
jgi:Asp-tRNA(Asn)/Glu-tRNA(Gln) amidotransferase A subunit family amidase